MEEIIRTLYAREHDIVVPKLGVFLAGPTPPSGEMTTGWRRTVIQKLQNDSRLNPKMIVVAPEPKSGNWKDIDSSNSTLEAKVRNQQIIWEWQYLNLCDITAFWMPTYFSKEKAENFPDNIGPTTRWEFGYYFQEYLKNPNQRKMIVGAPEDAESLSWAKKICSANGIKWHTLKKADKGKLVAESFIEEIAHNLAQNNWEF